MHTPSMRGLGTRHLIRRHLKHVAHPIIGDATHGKGPLNRWWAERLGQQRLWLHAQSLSLPHPVSGEMLHLQTDWPALAEHVAEVRDWQALMALPGWLTAPPRDAAPPAPAGPQTRR